MSHSIAFQEWKAENRPVMPSSAESPGHRHSSFAAAVGIGCRRLMLALVWGTLAWGYAVAQQLPPAEPPLPLPSQSQPVETLHVTTNEVLVPTLVEGDDKVVYGLKPSDFELTDNGVPQRLHVDEEMDNAPVALVMVVQQGRSAALEMDKVTRLGPLLSLFLGNGNGEIALVGFDSTPQLLHDFTGSLDAIESSLHQLQPGDGGAAILDTVSYGVDLLQTQPERYRRVLLLISERRDHGSKHIKPTALVQRIGASNILVLSISFSPSAAEFLHDLTDNGENRTTSMIGTLLMAGQAMRKNAAKELARLSGGEYATFTKDKALEEHLSQLAQRVHNRYLLSFRPSDPAPGLHTLRVRLTRDYGAKVVARTSYWAAPNP